MKCPHCGKDISDQLVAHHLASKGGKKSKRTLTKQQATEMAKASAVARHKKKHNKDL